MRLEEIEAASAAEQRVKRLKANANAAKDHAKQMKAQADASAEQVKVQQSRQRLAKLSASASGATIKPHT